MTRDYYASFECRTPRGCYKSRCGGGRCRGNRKGCPIQKRGVNELKLEEQKKHPKSR